MCEGCQKIKYSFMIIKHLTLELLHSKNSTHLNLPTSLYSPHSHIILTYFTKLICHETIQNYLSIYLRKPAVYQNNWILE